MIAIGGMSREEIKDRAQDYLIHFAKSKESHEIVLTVLHDWLKADSKESFMELYPESHPSHSIALATALVGG